MNCWYDDPKYTEDKVKEMLEPFADRIATECGVKTSFNSVPTWLGPSHSSISFDFMGYPVGFISFNLNYPTEDWALDENKFVEMVKSVKEKFLLESVSEDFK